jgi:Ni,Fe-hydrogenase III small subunit
LSLPPRHADGLLITDPVTESMKGALQKTYHAVPTPKIVIAVGAWAISGGPYINHPEVHDGADAALPLDVHIPALPSPSLYHSGRPAAPAGKIACAALT